MPREITVAPYDPQWPALFQAERETLSRALGDIALEIYHFGSTAVPGMSAKPTIDILATVRDIRRADARRAALEAAGYLAQGENGIPGRRYFVRLCEDGVSHACHLHIYEPDAPHVRDELLFRDFLRADPASFREYEEVKKRAAALHRFSPEAYTEAKTDCVRRILQRARESLPTRLRTACDFSFLRAGMAVRLSGEILTARDAAHARLCAMLDRGEPLPIALRGAIIYYAGPCPPRPGQVVGACGPTTSGRMDACAPQLLRAGLKATIGKGPRNSAVLSAMSETGSVYFAATGGAGALLASRVKAARVVAFADLGTEAIRALEVADFPLLVAADAHGGDLYRSGPAAWCQA